MPRPVEGGSVGPSTVGMRMERAGIERRGIIVTGGGTCGCTATIATATGTMNTCAASSAAISQGAAPTVDAGAGRMGTIALTIGICEPKVIQALTTRPTAQLGTPAVTAR
jgi:hypothetical protein